MLQSKNSLGKVWENHGKMTCDECIIVAINIWHVGKNAKNNLRNVLYLKLDK